MNNIKFTLVLTMLCLTSSYLQSQNYQDCDDPFSICDLKTYHIPSIKGIGEKQEDFKSLKCADSFNEVNSIWLEWRIKKGGALTFVINPANVEDDVDFVLFRKEDNCDNLAEVRCMASGITYGETQRSSQPCKGSTGLDYGSIDEFELSGCKYSDDNYLKFLNTEPNEKYLLLINNYESSEGFSISFDGKCELSTMPGCITSDIQENIMITDVFPNPTVEYINLEYIAFKKSNLSIELRDMSGKLLKSNEVQPNQGLNKHTFELTEYPSGIYLLKVTQDDYTTVKQFVVN